MSAEFKTYQTRMKLIDMLPLINPISIHICPTTFCNFKCKYCVHSLSTNESLPNGLKKEYMSIETFKKIVDQLVDSNIKLLNFAYLGELLLNSKISEMVKLAKDASTDRLIDIYEKGII